MQKYSHDYTKVSEAESHLYAAQQLNAHGDPIEAWKHIEDARRLLQEYLAQDNMVPDDDVADGWVKASEISQRGARLCRLLPTGRKTVPVVRFSLFRRKVWKFQKLFLSLQREMICDTSC